MSLRESAAPRDVDVLVVGDVNPDILVEGGDPLFGQREVLVRSIVLTVGGSAGIMAAAAVRMGLRVALVGIVGDDVFGRFMLDELRQRGVDVTACRTDPARPTGATAILTRPTDRAILTAAGTIADLAADDVPGELLRRSRHVHVASYYLQPALRSGMASLISRTHDAGATISIDPNGDPSEIWDGGLREVLADVDVFLPNETEATRISGEMNAADAARQLRGTQRGHGPTIVVKRGNAGALAVDRTDEVTSVPGVPVEPVDATGAGDAFDAAFLAEWLDGRALGRCLAFAAAAGALSTRQLGGVAGLATRAEVEGLLGADESGPA